MTSQPLENIKAQKKKTQMHKNDFTETK